MNANPLHVSVQHRPTVKVSFNFVSLHSTRVEVDGIGKRTSLLIEGINGGGKRFYWIGPERNVTSSFSLSGSFLTPRTDIIKLFCCIIASFCAILRQFASFASFCVILCHFVSFCVILRQFASFCVILCHFVSFCVILCHFVSFCAIFLHFVSFYVILCHFVSFYIILCHFASFVYSH